MALVLQGTYIHIIPIGEAKIVVKFGHLCPFNFVWGVCFFFGYKFIVNICTANHFFYKIFNPHNALNLTATAKKVFFMKSLAQNTR